MNQLDDLTVITGIGAARQRWLRETFGVQTYADLAALSAEDIESRLRQEEQIISRKTIDVWIAEAQDRATAAAETVSHNSTTLPVPDSTANAESMPLSGKEDWKEFATFVIEFQERTVNDQTVEYRTTVFHALDPETGRGTPSEWPGLDSGQYSQWMLEQVKDKINLEPATPQEQPLAPRARSARSLMRVQIKQLRFFQPAEAATPAGIWEANQPFEGLINSRKPLALEINFNLETETAGDFPEESVDYAAQIYAKDVSTNDDIHVGETEPAPFVSTQRAYTVRLSDLTLPRGLYQLFVIITVEGPFIKPHFVKLPAFAVS